MVLNAKNEQKSARKKEICSHILKEINRKLNDETILSYSQYYLMRTFPFFVVFLGY